jgi:acyl-CoA thioesterase-1
VPDAELKPPRKNSDVIAYNAVAKKIMTESGIAMDDLYAFVLPQLTAIQRPANVHFSDEGSATLAKQVAASIEAALPKP